MVRKATRRKTNTALVFNPARRLSIGGAKVNPVRKRRRKTSRRRRNPVSMKRVAVHRNPVRRRNPASASGLLVAAIMAGVGVSLFDAVASRVLPQTSPLIRTGVKFGGAAFFQSKWGNKVPVLGRYKNDIALVLAVAGMVDLMKLYVLPLVSQTVANVGLLIPAPAPAALPAGDGTTAGIYGNAVPVHYRPFA